MTTALTTFNAQVDRELRGVGDDELTSDERDAFIKDALQKYSKDRPKEVRLDLSGDGGKYYEINTTTFTSWVEDFSRIVSIEYPAADISADDTPEMLLPDHDWADNYWKESKRYLYLPNHTPESSEEMRIVYTAPYLFSGDPEATSAPEQDFYAICVLAASYCCGALAAKYGQSLDPTISADAVRYGTKSGQYERRADKLLLKYNDHMGLGKSGVRSASVIHEWDVRRAAMAPRHRRRTR